MGSVSTGKRKLRWEGPVAGIPGAIVRHVASLPDSLPGAQRAGFYSEAIPGQLLQIVPGVARYLASDGNRIEVAPEPDCDNSALEIFLTGAVRAALIYQRGELPLHAATLMEPGGESAIAICGPSGAGKSTLAAELSTRGWLLLADDTTRLSWDGSQTMAWPSRGAIKLWADALRNRDEDVAQLEQVRSGMEKFFVPVAWRDEVTPLRAVVELSASAEPGVTVVSGVQRVTLLTEHTFRPRQIRPLGMAAAHLRIVAQVAASTRLYRLGGARELAVAKLADQIMNAGL